MDVTPLEDCVIPTVVSVVSKRALTVLGIRMKISLAAVISVPDEVMVMVLLLFAPVTDAVARLMAVQAMLPAGAAADARGTPKEKTIPAIRNELIKVFNLDNLIKLNIRVEGLKN